MLAASGGHEAISMALQHAEVEIDLLVTDMVMPLMGGKELAKRLADTRPQMKVLYISGYSTDDAIRDAAQQTDAQFLEKPFTTASLALKVREALDGP